jgi:hypothetical protein
LRRWTRCVDLLGNAQAIAFAAGDKNGGEKTQQRNDYCQHPGTFFKNVRSLFDAHQLVAKTTHVSSQTTALGILHQNDQSKDSTGDNDQDHKKYHIRGCLIVRFWQQNKRFFQD